MRFKKGELALYKSHTPKELKDIYDKFPKLQESITFFVENYTYNHVKKRWNKKPLF